MNSALADRFPDLQPDAAADVQPSVRPSLHRDAASDEGIPHVSDGATMAAEANSFIEAASVSSVKEVARLIAELQGVRDLLQSESQHVQREVGEFFHLNDSAFKAAKMMVKSISQWSR
jgi:hypothetical protein